MIQITKKNLSEWLKNGLKHNWKIALTTYTLQKSIREQLSIIKCDNKKAQEIIDES